MDSDRIIYCDPENIRAAANGNREAFNRIYRALLPGLTEHLMRITHSHELTEEIIQEIFLKLWLNKERWEHIKNFRAYVHRMARNRSVDIARANALHQTVSTFVMKSAQGFVNDIHQRVESKSYLHIINHAIKQLPRKRKQICELHLYRHFTTEEMATALGISKSVVKKQLYSALLHIRLALRKQLVFKDGRQYHE